MKFETRAIHDGQEPEFTTGAVIVPVYQTTTYHQEAIGKHKGYEYSRTGNPTRTALEEALASLEGGAYGLAFASGLAASDAVLRILNPGEHLLAGEDLYGGTFRLLEKVYKPWGLQPAYFKDVEDLKRKIVPHTRMVWIETPTNPLLHIMDIQKIAEVCHEEKIILVVDNTFASPYFQNPLALGADIVVHSTTKYLGGHSDVIGGAVITSNPDYYEKIKYIQNAVGGVPAPWDCWLTLRGVKTLSVRMREHEKNAKAIASFLQSHPKVERVYYPGLEDSPEYEIACKQMRGFGGMVSFEVKGGLAETEKVIARFRIFLLAESLGGVESLVCYPPEMTHASLSSAEREQRGIHDNLLRLSVGIEHIDDLKQDLEQALG
jgi:cystathionine gamma-synthase/cystathionine gamma-lyase